MTAAEAVEAIKTAREQGRRQAFEEAIRAVEAADIGRVGRVVAIDALRRRMERVKGRELVALAARLDRLEALADGAPQGPWIQGKCEWYGSAWSGSERDDDPKPSTDGEMVIGVCDCGLDSDSPQATSAYLAALDPDTVRELVRLARRALTDGIV